MSSDLQNAEFSKTELSKILEPHTLLTSHDVGALLQVNPSSVNKWVKENRISCYRTPGGHRRIRAFDLMQFLDRNQMPIPRDLEPLAKRRLLLVDDDEKLLKGMVRLLKKHAARVEVRTSTNGVDALVQVGAFKPHAIVLDVYMPDLGGIEVCRRLKANPDTAAINVVVSSGRAKHELGERALKAGAMMYVEKPIDLDAILQGLGLTSAAVHASA